MSHAAEDALQRGVYVSALELFSIGIGPSSSHTVGPMRAGLDFRDRLASANLSTKTARIRCKLQGSLAATGVGHGTPDAVIAGLRGLEPESCNPQKVHRQWERLAAGQQLSLQLDAKRPAIVVTAEDIEFLPRERGLGHPNSMVLLAEDTNGEVLQQESYLSIGGGFIERVDEGSRRRAENSRPGAPAFETEGSTTAGTPISHYQNMAQLLELTTAEAGQSRRTIADIAWADESAIHGPAKAAAGLDAIWSAMRSCIENGLRTEGMLPGRLGVKRRAAAGWAQLHQRGEAAATEEALSIYALAVNEENAAGGRVVTAPTNGAAGVLPAVLYHAFNTEKLGIAEVRDFLLTATAVGSIFKANASISGAEAGCQAEVGSACAMAAAGLTAVRGGTTGQIENAAEIAIEHHLGLTCDPVGGLVQIPCIERNAVAAATAQTASRLALLGDGTHVVHLDTTIETMRQTGADMSERYKETSAAGLAVNVVEC